MDLIKMFSISVEATMPIQNLKSTDAPATQARHGMEASQRDSGAILALYDAAISTLHSINALMP